VLPALPGATESPDLEQRERLIVSSLGLVSAGNRAGGLDVVHGIARVLDSVAGPRIWRGRVRWFDNSTNNQTEVVRHFKGLLEDTAVDRPCRITTRSKASLPRNGPDLDLTVLVSPGDVDPEAERLDVHGRVGLFAADRVLGRPRPQDRTRFGPRLSRRHAWP
jgi:hypothetical protein